VCRVGNGVNLDLRSTSPGTQTDGFLLEAFSVKPKPNGLLGTSADILARLESF